MPLLMLKDLPRYECLLEAAEENPSLDPTACEAFFHLLRTGDDIFSTEARFLTQHNISQGRFTVMMLLHHGCTHVSTPAELAEAAGVTRATMTGLIDTLEKDGLVERGANPSDRRTVRVKMTSAGEAFLAKILPDYFRCVSGMIRALSVAERKLLVELLQKIQQGLATEKDEALRRRSSSLSEA
ncbi:MAG: MarR family transcriptional regulator [Verrucomicrobiaceae bacterium]|nr:MAG: MarR family transcriptional regulator [Verrucomicrobiaceae bacterium]